MIDSPNCVAESERNKFRELVLCGGEVQRRGLKNLVNEAKALLFLHVDKQLVGVAGIKRPRNKHRNDVFRDAGVPEYACKFQFELGWVFVKCEYRGKGYSRALSAAAMSEAEGEPTFATTRLDKPAMQRTLERLGFRRLGDSWLSTLNENAPMGLYVKT